MFRRQPPQRTAGEEPRQEQELDAALDHAPEGPAHDGRVLGGRAVREGPADVLLGDAAAALVGMLPILLYLYLATRGPSDPLSASISPISRMLGG